MTAASLPGLQSRYCCEWKATYDARATIRSHEGREGLFVVRPNVHIAKPWLDSIVWVAACAAAVFSALGFAAAGAVEGTWDVVAGWLICAGVAIAAISYRNYLPIFFGFLVTLGAVINMSGYAFGLWHDRTPFDEVVHAYTSFAGMAAGGWLFLRRRSPPGGLIWKMAIVGAIIGTAWEIFEWSIGIIGDPQDTGVDLLMDVLGSIFAAVLVRWSVIPESEHEAGNSPAA